MDGSNGSRSHRGKGATKGPKGAMNGPRLQWGQRGDKGDMRRAKVGQTSAVNDSRMPLTATESEKPKTLKQVEALVATSCPDAQMVHHMMYS